jgi:hypothetical protein
MSAMTTPKRQRSRICVWKICSKPLKKEFPSAKSAPQRQMDIGQILWKGSGYLPLGYMRFPLAFKKYLNEKKKF